MISLKDSLVELVENKLVEPEETYFKATDKEGHRAAFRTRGITLETRDP